MTACPVCALNPNPLPESERVITLDGDRSTLAEGLAFMMSSLSRAEAQTFADRVHARIAAESTEPYCAPAAHNHLGGKVVG